MVTLKDRSKNIREGILLNEKLLSIHVETNLRIGNYVFTKKTSNEKIYENVRTI